MGKYVFKLPDLGEGIVESEIATLHVKVGDTVKEDDAMIDMMTDKAVVELPAPVDGKVTAVAGSTGDIIAVGSSLVEFEIEGEGNAEVNDAEPAKQPEPKKSKAQEPEKTKKEEKPAAEKMQQAKPTTATNIAKPIAGKVLAAPVVRRRALDKDIDLTLVPGTGPAGRITTEDLDNFIAGGGTSYDQVRIKQTAVTEIPVQGLRRVIAEKMQSSKRNIPHFTYTEELDITDLEKLRQHMNEQREAHQPKLTILPFIMLAMVKAMSKFPQCNAHFDDQNEVIYQYSAVHLGIAAQTNKGLMVPVVRHAEAMNIWQAAEEMKRVAEAAKNGNATREELSGSTITISSLGKLGGIVSTPVINAPEVSIIAVNKLVEKPVVVEGQIQIRKTMNLSSSFDHRVVDGYDAAAMIQYVKNLLENPATLFI